MSNGVNLLQQALQARAGRRQQGAMFDAQLAAQEQARGDARQGQQEDLASRLQAALQQRAMEAQMKQAELAVRGALQTQGEQARYRMEMDTGAQRNAGSSADQQARAAAEQRLREMMEAGLTSRNDADNVAALERAKVPHQSISTRVGGSTGPGQPDARKSPEYLQMATDAKILGSPSMYMPADIQAAKVRYEESAKKFGDHFGLLGPGAPPPAPAPQGQPGPQKSIF